MIQNLNAAYEIEIYVELPTRTGDPKTITVNYKIYHLCINLNSK